MNIIISRFRYTTTNVVSNRFFLDGEAGKIIYRSAINESTLNKFNRDYTPFPEYY